MTTEVSGVGERRSTNKNGYNSFLSHRQRHNVITQSDRATHGERRGRGGGGGKKETDRGGWKERERGGGGGGDRQTDRQMERYKQKDKAQHSKLNTEAQANNGVIKPIVRPNIHDKTDLGR